MKSNDESSYPCFRCGNCCRLWVFLSYEEAEKIAEFVKLPIEEFALKYPDKAPDPEKSLILHKRSRTCVFLRNGRDIREKYCQIYEVRPRPCRNFVPSPRAECEEGLKKVWNLTMTSTGDIEGSEEEVMAFASFLNGLSRV